MEYKPENIRNVMVVGHQGSGNSRDWLLELIG